MHHTITPMRRSQLGEQTVDRHVPVMMVTGDDRIESVAAARQFNAVGYILKPFARLAEAAELTR